MQHAYVYAGRVARGQPLCKGANIHSEVTLVNRSNKCWSGCITARIRALDREGTGNGMCLRPKNGATVLQWTEEITVAPGSTVYQLQPQLMKTPKLWWPIHLGDQVLKSIHTAMFLFAYFGLFDTLTSKSCSTLLPKVLLQCFAC